MSASNSTLLRRCTKFNNAFRLCAASDGADRLCCASRGNSLLRRVVSVPSDSARSDSYATLPEQGGCAGWVAALLPALAFTKTTPCVVRFLQRRPAVRLGGAPTDLRSPPKGAATRAGKQLLALALKGSAPGPASCSRPARFASGKTCLPAPWAGARASPPTIFSAAVGLRPPHRGRKIVGSPTRAQPWTVVLAHPHKPALRPPVAFGSWLASGARFAAPPAPPAPLLVAPGSPLSGALRPTALGDAARSALPRLPFPGFAQPRCGLTLYGPCK